MKYLLILLTILIFTTPQKKSAEFISIIHIGCNDHPIYPVTISKDSVSNTITVNNIKGKTYYFKNANNYIVDVQTYNDFKTLTTDFKKNSKYGNKPYEYLVFISDERNHKYFLEYKESVKLLKLLINHSKSQNNTKLINRFTTDFGRFTQN